jgi:glucose-1-phosphate cytidylyltransferase
MKVVLFCGGQGLRMNESSQSIPKPMVPIGDRPILWHIMKFYAHFGHTDFILCLGYHAKIIKRFFLEYNEAISNDFVFSAGGKDIELLRSDIDDWRITFVDTGLNANVGQRLKAVEDLIGDDEVFLATYGDGLTDVNLDNVVDTALASGKTATFLCSRPSTYSFHTVNFENGGRVTGIVDVAQSDFWINAGFFVLRREIFDLIGEGEELVDEPFARLIEQGELLAYPYLGFFAPMDTLKDKNNLEALAEAGNPPWAVWDGRETVEPAPETQ